MEKLDMVRAICSKGGMILYEDLGNIAPLQEVKTIITHNPDKFAEVCLGGRVFVRARCSLSLCEELDCTGCHNLHMCEDYMVGICEDPGCPYSHDLHSTHNLWVLKEHGLIGLKEHEIYVLLSQDEPPSRTPPAPPKTHADPLHTPPQDDNDQPHTLLTHKEPPHAPQTHHEPSHAPQTHHEPSDTPQTHTEPPDAPQTHTEPPDAPLMHTDIYRGPTMPPLPLNTPEPAPRRAHGRLRQARSNNALPFKPDNAGSDELCHLYLIYRCSDPALCGKAHSRVPYLWQRKEGKTWSALPNNEDIERDYCNPAKTTHDGTPSVDFGLFLSGSDEVRRLSVTSPAFLTASELVTQWAWYWELAEDTWREYRPTKENPKSTSITSEKLEQKLQEGVQSFNFASGENVYTLNFIEFIQTNMASGMMRLVRRRPVFFSHADVQKVSEKYAKRLQPNFLSSIPEHWDRSLLPGTGYERVQLPATSPEYKRVLHRFNSTMGGTEKKGADKMAGGVRRVKSMERIQNLKLWRFFMLQRNQMKNEAGGEVCVKQLFHGAKAEYIDTICHMNIDWRVNGLQDTRFGTGSYFYCDASSVHKYTDQQEVVRFLFLCQVLVGDAALGRAVFSTPPFKDDRKTSSYDSCVDDEARPSLYVLFERNQVYPEYLIQYTSTEEDKQQPATPTTPVPVTPAPAIPATPAPAPALAPAPPAPAPVAQPVYERLTIMRQPGPYVPPAPAVEPKPICNCDCDWDICDCDGCDCCDDCDACDCFGF